VWAVLTAGFFLFGLQVFALIGVFLRFSKSVCFKPFCVFFFQRTSGSYSCGIAAGPNPSPERLRPGRDSSLVPPANYSSRVDVTGAFSFIAPASDLSGTTKVGGLGVFGFWVVGHFFRRVLSPAFAVPSSVFNHRRPDVWRFLSARRSSPLVPFLFFPLFLLDLSTRGGSLSFFCVMQQILPFFSLQELSVLFHRAWSSPPPPCVQTTSKIPFRSFFLIDSLYIFPMWR